MPDAIAPSRSSSAAEDPAPPGPEVSALPLRLPGLDVARALAALLVLVDHVIAGVLWLPSGPAADASAVARAGWHVAKAFGFWGVGLFFVLSGLCIHLPNARHHDRTGWKLDLGPYVRRRFTRIYPPHLFALLLSIAVVAAVPSIAARADHSLIKPPTLRFFVLHLFMIHTFFADAFASISVVLWTIAIESHFYLVYPLLLWARRRVSMRTICVGLLSLSLAVRVGSSVFISSPELRNTLANSFICRWWEWALGGYVAELLLARARPPTVSRLTAVLALAGALAIAVGLTDVGRANLPLTYVGPPVFALALFFAARMATSPGNPADRILVTLGRQSYSLYLTHPIAIAIATSVILALGLPWQVGAAVMLVFALLLSRTFFAMIERPFMTRAAALKLKAASKRVAAG